MGVILYNLLMTFFLIPLTIGFYPEITDGSKRAATF